MKKNLNFYMFNALDYFSSPGLFLVRVPWLSWKSFKQASNEQHLQSLKDSLCLPYSFPSFVSKPSLNCRKFSQPSLNFVLPEAHIYVRCYCFWLLCITRCKFLWTILLLPEKRHWAMSFGKFCFPIHYPGSIQTERPF